MERSPTSCKHAPSDGLKTIDAMGSMPDTASPPHRAISEEACRSTRHESTLLIRSAEGLDRRPWGHTKTTQESSRRFEAGGKQSPRARIGSASPACRSPADASPRGHDADCLRCSRRGCARWQGRRADREFARSWRRMEMMTEENIRLDAPGRGRAAGAPQTRLASVVSRGCDVRGFRWRRSPPGPRSQPGYAQGNDGSRRRDLAMPRHRGDYRRSQSQCASVAVSTSSGEELHSISWRRRGRRCPVVWNSTTGARSRDRLRHGASVRRHPISATMPSTSRRRVAASPQICSTSWAAAAPDRTFSRGRRSARRRSRGDHRL